MSTTENKELALGFFDDIAKGNIQGALDRIRRVFSRNS